MATLGRTRTCWTAYAPAPSTWPAARRSPCPGPYGVGVPGGNPVPGAAFRSDHLVVGGASVPGGDGAAFEEIWLLIP